MAPKYPNVVVKLTDQDSNAFHILGLCKASAKKAGLSQAEIQAFFFEAMANEVLKAQTANVRLRKMKGELVDRAKALAAAFDFARRERDVWMNWPPRIAANMAAELGVALLP